ncbi:hypothetical protein COU75_03305 [Candidatus Peregrinibacteria bacterium CG10_big_fil_rev_8_21_14_0_10_42_8]|nr:MAG: hypothetical protein COU75_03305 [Candidatus Peregrinibacteria bacterium CG10_big_fil_rev_8_21_14_0_10_42_8]
MQYISFVILSFISKAHAQIVPCPIDTSTLPCDAGGTGNIVVVGIFLNGAKIAFGSILFAMLVFYGIKLIMGADNDSTITESYHSYAYAAIGTILAGGAFAFANTFAVQGVLVDAAPTNSVLIGVIVSFRALIYSALVFNIFYQGFRLVSSQDEGQAEKAKKQFIYGLVGAAIALLAEPIVFGFSTSDSGAIGVQAVGIANFIGTILGTFTVIAMFVAGLYLVFAVNEQNSDKAKKVLIGALIVLIVVIMSLALINIAHNAPLS